MCVDGQPHALAVLPPVMTRYPFYMSLGGHQSRGGRVRKISPPPGFDPRTVHHVANELSQLQYENHLIKIILVMHSSYLGPGVA